MSETMKLSVKTVIGDGNRLMLIPLICQWKVPQDCLWNMTGEKCSQPLDNLYVLEEPLQGHLVVGVCEEHHKALGGTP